jgi:DHA1 family inner membrane transport protein
MAPSPPGHRTDWPRAALLLLCGVFAATQIGKLPPAIPALREQFGASLVQLGWIASIFNLVAASIGLLLGLLADRAGRRRLLKLGLVALGAGALLGAASTGLPLLFASRILEGLGFVCIVVAAPVLVREAVGAGQQRLALGLWSSYTAIGMTLMMLASPWVLLAAGWRGGWWFGAAGALLLLAVVLRVFPGRGERSVASPGAASLVQGLRAGTPWLLAVCFFLYTLQWMAMMVWMPTYLLDALGLGLVSTTAIVALLLFVNAPGNWLGGWLSQRQVSPAALILGSGLVMGATGCAAFALDIPAAPRMALCLVFSFVGGILPASIYAAVPAVAARHDNLGSVNGLVVQASNLGTLLGPPLAAALVAAAGWRALAPIFAMAALLMTGAVLALARSPDLHPGVPRHA